MQEKKRKREINKIREKYDELQIAALNYDNLKAYDHYFQEKGIKDNIRHKTPPKKI